MSLLHSLKKKSKTPNPQYKIGNLKVNLLFGGGGEFTTLWAHHPWGFALELGNRQRQELVHEDIQHWRLDFGMLGSEPGQEHKVECYSLDLDGFTSIHRRFLEPNSFLFWSDMVRGARQVWGYSQKSAAWYGIFPGELEDWLWTTLSHEG